MSWRAGIHGYVARWGAITAPISRPAAPHLSRPARFERDCFTYDPARVAVWFMHRGHQSFGVGAEIGLRVWSDSYGLAFAFRPPSTAYSIACGVADGRYEQCSAGFRIQVATHIPQGVAGFDSISSAYLDEISICPRGACPGALCWHAGYAAVDQRPYVAALIPTWERGRALAVASGRC